MKKEVVDIIKQTLISLNKKDINAIPKNYSKEFYIQAEETDVKIQDLQIFKNIIKSLDEDERKLIELNKYNTYTEITPILLERISSSQLLEFIKILPNILAPSINYDIEEKIDNFVLNMKDNPKGLLKDSTIKELISISKKRQEQDRITIREKANDIAKLTTLMGKYFDKSLIQSGNSVNEIQLIKKELDELGLSEFSNREIGVLQGKLVDTVYNLENTMQTSQKELIQHHSDFNNLHETIQQLQCDLIKEKEEKHVDYLTGLLNRRAYEVEIEKFEHKYSVFDANYAIIFLDIDHFKKINDNYGHDCGDAVLKTFANILKMLTRDEDKVIRYGGEEFVTLIRFDKEREVQKYVTRIKQLIDRNNFVYNDIKLKINFCAGVSIRNKYKNYADAVKSADKLLYEAKHTGRNKIISDDGRII